VADRSGSEPSKDLKTKDEATEGFVTDRFFEHGNLGLKVRQAAITLLIWAFLIIPILVVINSTSRHVVWNGLYHWSYVDGFVLVHFLDVAIVVIFVVILAFSIYLLLRNNHREKRVYPFRKTYDVDGLEKRKQIIERMYEERFGDDATRHASRYYVVTPEQNLPTGFVQDRFREGQTDVGKEAGR
jgi:hypothetical protein